MIARIRCWLAAFAAVSFTLPAVAAPLATRFDFEQIASGYGPAGSIAISGNQFFGGTTGGGPGGNESKLWSFSTDTNTYTQLHSFSHPADGVIISGVTLSGGTLFGTATLGGTNDKGTLWSYNTSSSSFAKLHDFASVANGDRPDGAVAVAGNLIYGTASAGGANNLGTIWSYNTLTNSFAKLRNLSAADGSAPNGPVVLDGNLLYGASNIGGAGGGGTLWSFDVTTNAYAKLHEFSAASGSGTNLVGGVIQAGSKLYGMAEQRGANNQGTLWSYDTITNLFTKLHNFDGTGGAFPHGGLTVNSGKLIGTTAYGGAGNEGTLWSYDLTSTVFIKLHDFSSATGGVTPEGGLVGWGDVIYGTTMLGGADGSGTLWSIPEPSGIVLATAGLFTLLGWRARRRGVCSNRRGHRPEAPARANLAPER